ncbi:hypothetical protein CTRI78_v010282 [Colletotrichum trifolii]|uniref:SnoaL-like domain-containing protein n=1 Tax=Colletotrichum trifolii TaxID=5466 RepID=A0A4R8QN37_COLTR|nr:hypothetical protein CTRI78_v010282 [Colletotrichum trifolii]
MRPFPALTLGFAAVASAGSGGYYVANNKALPNCPPRPASPAEQLAIFDDFIQKFYVEYNFTGSLLEHVPEDYIQHNPHLLSGRQNAIDFFSTIVTAGTSNFTIIHKAFEDNTAYIHYRSESTGAAEPSAVVDIFRFDGSCMVEHWDVIQERPANATNPLALF